MDQPNNKIILIEGKQSEYPSFFFSLQKKDMMSRSRVQALRLCKRSKRPQNELGTLNNNEIRELPFLHRLHSEPRFQTPFYPGYYCFECDDVIDIVDPKIAFMDLYRRDESFCSFMTGLADYFDVRPEQLGVFGSVAMGCDSAGDYDIIFYGNKKELKRIRDLITEMNSIHGVPRVGGRTHTVQIYI